MPKALGALIAGGCDVDRPNKLGWTPACIAAQHGHLEVLLALVGAGQGSTRERNSQLQRLRSRPLSIDVRHILIVPFGGTHGNVIIRVVEERWVDIFCKRSVQMSTESQEAATEAKMKIKNALYQMPFTQEKYYLVNVEFQEIHSEDYYRPPLFKVEIWAIYAIDVDESEEDDGSKLL